MIQGAQNSFRSRKKLSEISGTEACFWAFPVKRKATAPQNSLSRLPELRVMARSTVFSYMGRENAYFFSFSGGRIEF
jgi:hypothetical protein